MVLAVGVAGLVLAVGVVAAMILFIEVILPDVALLSVSSAFVGTLAVLPVGLKIPSYTETAYEVKGTIQ